MGLLNRLSTLVKADAHGMVDAVEDRALLLRQHVREAEAELNRKQARLGALQAERKTLEEESLRAREKMAELEEDISLAMDTDKEELARFAIKKLLPLRRRLKHIEQRLQQGSEEQESLSETLNEQQGELDRLRARVRAYLAQADTPAELGDLFREPIVEEEEVEMELLRRRQATRKGAK